jgi:DNA-binding NtrC family response regulator
MNDRSDNSSSEEFLASVEDSYLFKIALGENEFEEGVFSVFIAFSTFSERARFKAFMEKVEKIIILRTLRMFNGSQKDAAKFLGINHTTLHEKVKKYKIQFQKTPVEL